MSTDQTPPPQPTDGTDWTNKQLPPVKPPTTGFLMQLFFVPMIIVSIIVGVWLMFGWLAQSGTNPKQLAENLRHLNKGSWQDAHSLSNLLRDPREKELRKDAELADGLAETLKMLIEDPNLSVSVESHKLATWLCQALGEFEIDNGLDALVAAVQSDDFKIKRAAVEGIAKLTSNLHTSIADSRSDLVEVLLGPAMERAPDSTREEELKYGEMRGAVGYTLGVIGNDEAKDGLAMMLSDPYPEARYNAATGLARNGDVRAVDRLCEMLQLENEDATKYESDQETLRQWKRHLVIVNGLRSVQLLYTNNKEATPSDAIVKAVGEVEKSGILKSNNSYKYELDAVLRFLNEKEDPPH